MEVYKKITQFPDYEVSNYGNVRSIKKCKILSLSKSNGYLKISLYNNKKRKTCFVHRLVAFEFLPLKENKNIINHIDCNGYNNKIENIEWCNQSENIKHAHKLNRGFSYTRNKNGSDLSWSIPVKQYTKSNILIKEHESMNLASKEVGCSASHISECCNGIRKSTKGFVWKK